MRKEDQKQKALGLKGRKKVSLSGWLHQAEIFYKNILDDADLQQKLAQTNLSQEALQQAQSLVQAVSDLDSAQEKEKSEAQQATQERNQALDELNEWYSEVKELAFIAFEDNPQKLEALGFGAV